MRDSAPHGLTIDRDRLTRPNERVIDCEPEPVPEFESTLVSPSSQPRISRPARRASSPPSVVVRQPDANPTIPTRVRRPTSLLTYLALTGKLPRRVVFLLGAVIGCLLLFLIMLWRHMDSSGSQRVNAGEGVASAPVVAAPAAPAASAVPLVPLADAPQPSEAIVDIDENEGAVTSPAGREVKATDEPRHQATLPREDKRKVIPPAVKESLTNVPTYVDAVAANPVASAPAPAANEAARPKKTFLVKSQ